MNNEYTIFVETNTHNVNHGQFSCFAVSMEEAIGKLYQQRPDLRHKEIRTIYENTFTDDLTKVYS